MILACLRARPGAWSIILIPEFITDPNEGNTYGILPVVPFTDEDRIRNMLAPTSRTTTPGLLPAPPLRLPCARGALRPRGRQSTTKDERYLAEFKDRGLWDGRAWVFAGAMHEQDSTERFFGFGNNTREDEESNYTNNDTVAELYPGFWIVPRLGLAYKMGIRSHGLSSGQVDSLPFIAVEHPEVRGRGLERDVLDIASAHLGQPGRHRHPQPRRVRRRLRGGHR